MLGHVVARRASELGYEVLTSEERYRGASRDALVEGVRDSGATLVLNCIGVTKQRSEDPSALTLANAVFPLHLATRLRPTQYLIHASTDCVFAGTRGGYRVDDDRDATDAYGFSKLLGEGVARWPNATVLRVSVIGPEPDTGRGLMGWFLRQPPAQPIDGYANHRWNGITTLEWADLALSLAEAQVRGQQVARLVQPGTGVVTKYELLCAFRDIVAPDRRVAPTTTAEAVDRSLVPTDTRPAIREELQRLADWYPLRQGADA